MFKLIIFLLAPTICCHYGLAQKKGQDTIRKYLDNKLAFTTRAKMDFPALALKSGDHWLLMAVYPDTNTLLKAYFLDEKLTIKDGPFLFYHPKRIKAAEGKYINNIKQGEWKYWYKNGTLKDSGAFKNNYQVGEWRNWDDSGRLVAIFHYPEPHEIDMVARGVINREEKRPSILAGDTATFILKGSAVQFYNNGQMLDSGAYSANRKEGIWKQWYINGHLESIGTYVRGVQEGDWEFFRDNGTRSSKEKYVKNKVVALECFDEQGNFSGHACPIQKPAVALGKFLDFNKYALDNMFWPAALKGTDIQGDVEIEYTIDKDGKLEKLTVLSSPHQLMSEEVIRFFSTLTWSPAVSHNRPVEYTTKYSVPFYR
jgi:antitoxin component YwqK of YwqJK toxin-antitoxin module